MMEDIKQFSDIVITIGAVIGLLNVILFFKIWAMTNNVREIKETLKEWLDIEHPMLEEKHIDK